MTGDIAHIDEEGFIHITGFEVAHFGRMRSRRAWLVVERAAETRIPWGEMSHHV
jgi:hypothetical protein